MKIFYTDKEDKDVWGLRGWINQSHVDGLHIDDGVLYIHDFESNSLRYMKIKEGIPIEIEHSPKVQMLSREEVEAIKKRNKKQRWQYEF